MCVCALCVYAQEPSKPDLQTIGDGFFDPTRKTEKVQEVYQFGVEYRLEVGYAQNNQRTANLSYPDLYTHGARLGATVTFLLPKHFSLQTGLLYAVTYGTSEQHWRSMSAQTTQLEYCKHRVLEHNLVIPIRAYYTIPVWKQLNLFFYGGPQLQFALGETDYIKPHLSAQAQGWLSDQGIRTDTYDKVWSGELYHTNVQMGIGGGIEWDRYRLQGGYDFGLNNRVRKPMIENQHMWEWSWYVSFSYRF